MTLHIDLTAQTEAWIKAEAQQQGLRPVDIARRVLDERAATLASVDGAKDGIDAENAAAIAYLDRKLKEDATDDPDKIRKANEEFEELAQNLNANRAATGERLIF